jgi:flagellar FliL protein
MSKDEKETPAEAPKKSKKKLMIIVIAAVVLLGGGGGAFYFLKGSSAEAAPKEPEKGVVVTMENALTINLADGHYLKMAFTLQLTADAGTEAIDNSEAIDLAIEHYSGMQIGELETEKGRAKNKDEVLKDIEKAYYEEKDKKQIVMDIYFTQFVTQ